MITLDDLLVLSIVTLAAAFLVRRVWRRLHPRPNATGCAGCGGCGTAAKPTRPCSSTPRVRRG